MTPKDVFQLIKDKDVKFVDLRFTDTRGKEQHVSVPVKSFGPEKFESGHFFDGSSIAGWKGIQASDMLLLPDPTSTFIDPFLDQTTLAITCDTIEPSDMKGYDRDPRSIAKRGEAYRFRAGAGKTPESNLPRRVWRIHCGAGRRKSVASKSGTVWPFHRARAPGWLLRRR